MKFFIVFFLFFRSYQRNSGYRYQVAHYFRFQNIVFPVVAKEISGLIRNLFTDG